METVRMNITVDEDIPALLASLAGSKRFMGQWLTELLRDIDAGKLVRVGEVIDSAVVSRAEFDQFVEDMADIKQQMSMLLSSATIADDEENKLSCDSNE